MREEIVTTVGCVLAGLTAAFCLASMFVFAPSQKPASASLPRMEPLTATYTAEGGRVAAYVLTDPDTGVQYVVTDGGGITPRLDARGEAWAR